MLLFVDAGVRSLLDLEEYGVFRHPESMSAARHDHDVAGSQLPRAHMPSLVVVHVELAASLSDDDHFGCADEVPLERAVDVTLDLPASGIDNEPHLLLEIRWRE